MRRLDATFFRSRRGAPRGGAIVEFALVVPLLLTMILFSLYFVELVRAKLKLQEAGRYLAWEMTSHTLTDFGGNRHDLAFTEAMTKTLEEGKARFQDLDSIDERPANLSPQGTVAYSKLEMTLTNQNAPTFESPIPSVTGGGGPLGPLLLALNAGTGAVLNRWGFNPKGQVQAEVTMNLDNLILPRSQNLQSLALKNRLTLVANGWHLPDGADAEMHDTVGWGGPRAGVHRGGSRHGLYEQVGRMKFLGVRPSVPIPVLSQFAHFATLTAPNPFGTFVVAHNYGRQPGDRGLRGCTSASGSGYPAHPAQDGLNNLARTGVAAMDYPRNNCYDTIPFRDQDEYDDSQYVEMFKARGRYFMGCKKPMADDPSVPGPPESSRGDRNNKKVSCE